MLKWRSLVRRCRRNMRFLIIRTRAISIVFEKLTRACFFQIALETILLPILIYHRNTRDTRVLPWYSEYHGTRSTRGYVLYE